MTKTREKTGDKASKNAPKSKKNRREKGVVQRKRERGASLKPVGYPSGWPLPCQHSARPHMSRRLTRTRPNSRVGPSRRFTLKI